MKTTTWFAYFLLLTATVVGCTPSGAPAPAESAEAPTPAEVTETPAAPTAEAPASTPAPAPTRAPAPAAAPTPVAAEPAGRSDVKPAPEPVPAPEPEPEAVTVPAGTLIDVAFLDALSTAETMVGDSFRTRVINDVLYDGVVVIPAGSVVVGTVTEAVSANDKRFGGQARLAMEFNEVQLTSGRYATMSASLLEAGKSQKKKDALTIGGATAGGALLGRILKRDDEAKGTLIGAVVGAAAGTAIAAKNKGEELLIPIDTVAQLSLNAPTRVQLTP